MSEFAKRESDVGRVIELHPNEELMLKKSNDLSKESNDLPKELNDLSKESYSVELKKLLGSGGWNDVYSFKFTPSGIDSNHCIRLSKPEDKGEKGLIENIENEFKSQITLFSKCGKYIPKSFQTGKYYRDEEEVGSYIIMEKLGLNIFDIMVKNPGEKKGVYQNKWFDWINNEENKIHRVKFFKQIVECVKCMHNEANLCHFDIKNNNIMILDEIIVPNNPGETIKNINERLEKEERVVKLIDFGFSKQAYDFNHQRIQYDHLSGTEGYISPELGTHTATYDLRADLWALGVIYGHLNLVKMFEMPKLFAQNIEDRYQTTNEILKDLDKKLLEAAAEAKQKEEYDKNH